MSSISISTTTKNKYFFENLPSINQISCNVKKIALPIIALYGFSLLSCAEAGPVLYGVCVAACGPAAPACVAACLPLLCTPGP